MNVLPLPPPSRRKGHRKGDDPESRFLRLLEEGRRLYEVLARRSSADFRPVPVVSSEQDARLQAFLVEDSDIPASLVGELADHLSPRLEKLKGNLRRRLARSRAEIPLSRVRELDPVCMRVNARRPGLTVVDKAGPKQRLMGVIRIERFDTVENRVLVATSRRIAREAAEILGQLPAHARSKPRARALGRLERAAVGILDRPELAEVVGPRPGDQPSNALLSDPDYRAIWRTHRLLLEQEERFASEWAAIADVRRELALAAAWSLFTSSTLVEVPNSLLVLRDREGGHRLQTLGPRTWIRVSEDQLDEYAICPTNYGFAIVARRFGAQPQERTFRVGVGALDALAEDCKVDLQLAPHAGIATVDDDRLADAPRQSLECHRFAAELRTNVLEFVGAFPEPPRASREPTRAPGFVGVTGLDRMLRVATDHSVDTVDVTAALELVHGDARLPFFGASAVYGHGVVGPAALHSTHAALGGQLIASKRPPGAKGLAVVVPDRADELSLRALRSTLGRTWFVWQPVAVALAATDQLPSAPVQRALVVALSDAVDDVTVLSCQHAGTERACWLRDQPLRVEPWSLERAFLDAAKNDANIMAAWIRAKEDDDTTWVRHLNDYQRARLPSVRDARLRALEAALATIKVAVFDVVIIAGGDKAVEDLVTRTVKRPAIRLPAHASAIGARNFLQRHNAGLPTWKDRLPHLAIEVSEHGMRGFVDIVPKDQWASPGQMLTFASATKLTLRARASAVDLHLSKDNQSVPYSLRLEGRPFPLVKAVDVRAHVRFEYGIEDIQGEFRPVESAPFQSLAFKWSAETSPGHATDQVARLFIPTYREPPPLSNDSWQTIQTALQGFTTAWSRVDQRTRNEAAKQPLLEKQLQPELRRLRDALRAVRGSGPSSMSKQQRAGIEQQVVGRLEWLLGIAPGPTKNDGRPPRLSDQSQLLVVQSRGHARVRGPNDKKLLKALGEMRAADEAMLTLGRILDGRCDHAFEQLVDTKTPTHGLRRRFGEAIREALASHPQLALGLSADHAQRLLERLVVEIELLDRTPNMRTNFAQLLLAIPQLCRARETGALPLDVAVPYARRLRELRLRLPPEVLKHAEGSDARDEPLSMAVDALEGREVNLPIVEVQ